MDQHRKYLAEKILTEDTVVTYRRLSRDLKVHVNAAKRMLFDFHQWQNGRQPGSVHATYLVAGTRDEPEAMEDDAVNMSSQMSYGQAASPSLTVALVAESQLKDWVAQFSSVAAIHMYSVGAQPVEDFALVTDAQGMAHSAEEPSSVLGTILNPRAVRRKPTGKPLGGGVAPPTTAAPAKPAAKPVPAKPATEAKPMKVETAAPTVAASSAKQAKLASSGIMSSFAKAANKPARPKEPVKAEVDVGAMSDDGDDEMAEPVDKSKAEESAAALAARRERQEQLRRMMEEDDDEEESEKEPEPPEEPEEEAMAVDEPPLEKPKEEEKPASSGPRRGRRKVMKKKQVQDAEGYLVTVQEEAWESFTEDEAPKPSQKPAAVKSSAGGTDKPKKAAPKTTQGSIASFFTKK